MSAAPVAAPDEGAAAAGPARRRRRLRRRGLATVVAVCAVVGAAVAVPLASGSDGPPASALGGSATGNSGTGTTSPPASGSTGAGAAGSSDPAAQVLAPAPPGFAQQLTGLYDEIHQAISTLGLPNNEAGDAASLPSTADYTQMVGRLSADDLSVLYAATLKQSGWTSLQPTYAQLETDAAGDPGAASAMVKAALKQDPATSAPAGSSTAKAKASTTTSPAHRTSRAARDATSHPPASSAHATVAQLTAAAVPFPPPSPGGSFPNPPQPYVPTNAVGPANVPATCPMPAPGVDLGAAAIYSAQLSADVLNETVDGLPSEVGLIVAGVPAQIPDPARIILEVAADASTLLLDQFNYMNNANNDCGYVTTIDYVENIDSTTINTFDLMTLMESTLDDVESSVNTISGQVHTVQQTLDDQLTITIEQDLAAPAGTTPDLALELPSSVGGNLDSAPIGVQKIVTAAVAQIGQDGEPENPAATQYLAMANAALTAGNDAQAYSDFHTAYLEATQ